MHTISQTGYLELVTAADRSSLERHLVQELNFFREL